MDAESKLKMIVCGVLAELRRWARSFIHFWQNRTVADVGRFLSSPPPPYAAPHVFTSSIHSPLPPFEPCPPHQAPPRQMIDAFNAVARSVNMLRLAQRRGDPHIEEKYAEVAKARLAFAPLMAKYRHIEQVIQMDERATFYQFWRHADLERMRSEFNKVLDVEPVGGCADSLLMRMTMRHWLLACEIVTNKTVLTQDVLDKAAQDVGCAYMAAGRCSGLLWLLGIASL
jgi:hypothetical protein